jgi:hypothetical protein
VDEWLAEYAALAAAGAEPAEDELDLLALMAEDPESGLVQLAPGVWTTRRTGGWSATR